MMTIAGAQTSLIALICLKLAQNLMLLTYIINISIILRPGNHCLISNFIVMDLSFAVTLHLCFAARVNHDENKHDPVEDDYKGDGQDHANPEWPISCSTASCEH